jgi:hypothetical protein
MVVSFMIAVPSLAGGLSPATNIYPPEPTPPPGFTSRTFWYAGCPRLDRATVSGETLRGKWVATA